MTIYRHYYSKLRCLNNGISSCYHIRVSELKSTIQLHLEQVTYCHTTNNCWSKNKPTTNTYSPVIGIHVPSQQSSDIRQLNGPHRITPMSWAWLVNVIAAMAKKISQKRHIFLFCLFKPLIISHYMEMEWIVNCELWISLCSIWNVSI